MKIGIIGSGKLGSTLARLCVGQGHVVAIANTRGPNSLPELSRELGGRARAATVTEVAIGGDVIILALPFGPYRKLPVEPFRRKLVIDATNYDPARDGSIPELDADRTTSTELIAQHLEGARVVKAFNTMPYETLASGGRVGALHDQRLALPLAGDDREAKHAVAELIEQLGFAAVDNGSLAPGGRLQQPGSSGAR
ncbi:MAG: NADP oxidoreductase [Solirubrobacterales bacterium]|nr:MAG: NADP oxidoreductase [Solirubrobacterales bacterium]